MKCTPEELANILANAAFLKPFGFTVKFCAAGECTLVAPYAASLERPGGIVSELGKRTAYGTAECRAADGTLLAHHAITYALVAA